MTRGYFDLSHTGGAKKIIKGLGTITLHASVSGGLHHAAVRIAGENVYRHLKHEAGTHRVQRIPEVGLSSRMQRIHTGTMTVIILPQPVEVHSTLAFSSLCAFLAPLNSFKSLFLCVLRS